MDAASQTGHARRHDADLPLSGRHPTSPPLLRDPATWFVAALIVFASGYTVWLALGLGVPPLAAATGGAGTIPGAILVGVLALQVRRRRIFRALDQRAGWLIVGVCALYWVSAFTTPTSGATSAPQSVGDAVLYVAGLGLYPLLWWGLPALSSVRPSRLNMTIFSLDNMIVAWAGAMVLWHLLLYPLGRDAGASVGAVVLVAVSPAADLSLVLLAFGLSRVHMRGVGRPAMRLLVVAFMCVFAVDVSISVASLAPSQSVAVLPDLFRSWFWAVLALILLALLRYRDGSSEAGDHEIPSISWLPYAAIAVAFVLPAVVSWGDLSMLEQHIPASTVLIVFVLLRLGATARQNAGLVAAAAARHSEARFQALVQHASDLVALTDADSRVRYVTPSAARDFGLDRVALDDAPFTELLHPDDAAKGRAVLAEVAGTPGSTRRAEWRLRRADGSYCETEMLVSNMLDVPDVGGLVLTARDIGDRTARHRLEVELSRVQRMEAIGQLAAGIAHDFNNLLTAASGYAQLVRDTLPAGDPRLPDLDEIVTATDRGSVLVRQLLAFGRRQVMQPEVVDLNAIVEGIVPMLHRLLGEHIELASRSAAELGHVRADPSQLEQVVVNLASNARDAMPDGGRLTIETANVELDEAYVHDHASVVPGPYVMLAVSDTGVGMDATTLAHMFEPFFTTKGPDRGTGLGLATVYGIVNGSGGHVWAYSEPGQGTSFKVYLPRIDEPARPHAEERRAVPMGGAETILLVEDEEAVRAYATRVLRRFGYQVIAAASPGEALALPTGEIARVGLLVTDVIMPGHNGPELVARLAARAPGLRVLYVSGYAEQSVINHGLDQGAAFLAKPFSPETLAQKVRELLDA